MLNLVLMATEISFWRWIIMPNYISFIFLYLPILEMTNYHKKQKKHSRSIFLNTDEAYYVDSERKTFQFRINPINIEDESRLYVKNTITDYKSSGLAVKSVNTGLFLGSTATFSTTYSQNPAITFISQDGKGIGATAIGLLAPSGLSGSATATTTTPINLSNAGAGYTGVAGDYVANAVVPQTGGSGATITSGTLVSATGSFSAGTLVSGSGYTEIPLFVVPAPPASVPATFNSAGITAGVITTVPSVANPTLNGFYNSSTFVASFVSGHKIALGVVNTNASGTVTSISLDNASDNGYYDGSNPLTIVSINEIPLGQGFGTGLVIAPTYSGGKCASVVVTNGGTGYGANLVNGPIQFSFPSIGTGATITGATVSAGRITAITLGAGGTKYYAPTVSITAGLVTPVQAVYEPVFKIASAIAGARMLTHGRGYTLPPKPIIASTYRVSNAGDLPLISEITQPYNVEKNNYYTIKADGFQFNRTLYTNTDNKGTPTLAICSQNEDVNNENYTELILPAQVINDLTLTILDKDGNGLDSLKNMIMLLTIEELDEEDAHFHDSKRQEYSTVYSIS